MNDKDIQNLINQANQIKSKNPSEERSVKIAKLIVTLTKLETEFAKVINTLTKLKEIQIKENNLELANQISEKIEMTKSLKSKITKSKLNINYYFI